MYRKRDNKNVLENNDRANYIRRLKQLRQKLKPYRDKHTVDYIRVINRSFKLNEHWDTLESVLTEGHTNEDVKKCLQNVVNKITRNGINGKCTMGHPDITVDLVKDMRNIDVNLPAMEINEINPFKMNSPAIFANTVNPFKINSSAIYDNKVNCSNISSPMMSVNKVSHVNINSSNSSTNYVNKVNRDNIKPADTVINKFNHMHIHGCKCYRK